MNTTLVGALSLAGFLCVTTGRAEAQSAATCSYNPSNRVLTVTVNGVAATIDCNPADSIRLDGAICADPDTTETIAVNGGALADRVTLTGRFAPGFSVESDYDELEVMFSLGGGSDTVTIKGTATRDVWDFGIGPDALSWNSDADADIFASGAETVKLMLLGGDDYLDAGWYTGAAKLYLYGGDGNDQIFGTQYGDYIYGDAGNDGVNANVEPARPPGPKRFRV